MIFYSSIIFVKFNEFICVCFLPRYATEHNVCVTCNNPSVKLQTPLANQRMTTQQSRSTLLVSSDLDFILKIYTLLYETILYLNLIDSLDPLNSITVKHRIVRDR